MRVKGIPVSETLPGRQGLRRGLDQSEEQDEGTTSFSYHTPKFCMQEERRDRREGQLLDLMNRVLETMEKSERRMEEVDRKEVIKLEWQQAALVIDR